MQMTPEVQHNVPQLKRISLRATLIAAAIAFASTASGAGVLSTTSAPTEDAYVRSGFSSKKNFGREPILEVQNKTSEAFLKFDIRAIDRNLKEAILRLPVSAEKADPATLVVRSLAENIWTESLVTWKEKPAALSTLAEINITSPSPTWYELDITAFIKDQLAAGHGSFSLGLAIADGSNNKIIVRSREAEVNAPELVISRGLINAKIVFQPKAKAVPAGYIAETGAPFGVRTNGLSFGWSSDVSAFVKDRNVPEKDDPKPAKAPDSRYTGVAFMDHADMKEPAFWEIAVPNGKYKVHAVTGDSTFFDSVYAVNIEGTLTVDGIPDASKRWIEGTQIVEVKDKRLTVSSHPKGINNKLCFIEIAELVSP